MMKKLLLNDVFIKILMANIFSSIGRGMTLLGMAWYIVDRTIDGEKNLGIVMIIATITLMIMNPLIGLLIDLANRKNILCLEYTFGAIIYFIGAFTFSYHLNIVTLALIYILSMLLSQLHFPAQTAMIKEYFSREDYSKINSIVEVQLQITQMVAGGIAGWLLLSISISSLLLIVAVSLLLALAFTYKLPNKKHRKIKKDKVNFWINISGGYQYFKYNKFFLLFNLCTFFPFIILMISKYLAPIYVKKEILSDVTVYSTGEFCYGLGAFLFGILSIFIISRMNLIKFLLYNTMIFAFAMLSMAFYHQQVLFFAFYFLLGITMSSTKMIGTTITMQIVPGELIGRAITFVDFLALIIRLGCLLIFTLYIDQLSADKSFMWLSVLPFFAVLIYFFSLNKSWDRTKKES